MTEEPVVREYWTDDEAEQILDAISDWVEKEVRPIARRFDQADEYPHDLVEQMKELGLFGATIGREYGGLGLPAGVYAKIVATIAEAWMAPTGIFNSHLMMAACVERFGTDTQKSEFLPKFASGELRGGLALTEPNAGTDLQAIRTTALKDDDGYRINGTKTWITNGIHGQCVALLAKTDAHAEPRYRGMSLFIAERGDGFSVGKKLKKLGYRSIDSAELVFEDFSVPADRLIGEKEGQGFFQAVGGLELGRINIAARGVGLARASLMDSVRYSQERSTFGKPICKHQAIQLKLGEMATRVEAARLLVTEAARRYDAGERCDMEAGMAKLFASESAVENSLEAMRIHGGYSYSVEFDVERYFRDSPLMCIGEGTNEMQKMIIAKQLLDRNPI